MDNSETAFTTHKHHCVHTSVYTICMRKHTKNCIYIRTQHTHMHTANLCPVFNVGLPLHQQVDHFMPTLEAGKSQSGVAVCLNLTTNTHKQDILDKRGKIMSLNPPPPKASCLSKKFVNYSIPCNHIYSEYTWCTMQPHLQWTMVQLHCISVHLLLHNFTILEMAVHVHVRYLTNLCIDITAHV